ncbi:adenylyl-sulfate kinase [Pseudomonas sp.]|uniref:adenylyl-sulfate kinase n=1 Tax=Pseudomonas sp. TaxID=306 RepID=UPI003C56D294
MNNTRWQEYHLDQADRTALKGHKPCTVWFTGLSGSGKSTVANALDQLLNRMGCHTYVLDGDNLRQGLNKDLGFSAHDRVENIRRVGEVSKLFTDAGLIVLCAFISPYSKDREFVKNILNHNEYVEIYLSTPIEECERRDPKGLYKKARAGSLPDFTGVHSPYEVPTQANLEIDTSGKAPGEIADAILSYLVSSGIVTPALSMGWQQATA